MKIVKCFFSGRDKLWEGIRLDYNLAVQGHSMSEVENALKFAIEDYIEASMNESEPTRSMLLNRKSPFGVRALWHWRLAIGMLTTWRHNSNNICGFTVTCPA